MNTEQAADKLQMEQIVDKMGLSTVRDILVGICHEKAEHIRANWQDDELAARWERTAQTFENAKLEV